MNGPDLRLNVLFWHDPAEASGPRVAHGNRSLRSTLADGRWLASKTVTPHRRQCRRHRNSVLLDPRERPARVGASRLAARGVGSALKSLVSCHPQLQLGCSREKEAGGALEHVPANGHDPARGCPMFESLPERPHSSGYAQPPTCPTGAASKRATPRAQPLTGQHATRPFRMERNRLLLRDRVEEHVQRHRAEESPAVGGTCRSRRVVDRGDEGVRDELRRGAARARFLDLRLANHGRGAERPVRGGTGDSSSPHASSPFNRIGQHLEAGRNAKANALARRLKTAGLVPERCRFEMVAVGPLFPEQEDMERHRAFRDQAGALERALADHLRSGHEVIGHHPRAIACDDKMCADLCRIVDDKLGPPRRGPDAARWPPLRAQGLRTRGRRRPRSAVAARATRHRFGSATGHVPR